MARKCIAREIDKNTASDFLNKYHIQGFSPSTVYLGCLYNDRLVAVMSFKEWKKEKQWELTRFATDYHYICQGIGGKLFKHFVMLFKPIQVKSFADRRWTTDATNNLYIKLGFILDKILLPDYRYIIGNDYTRRHKFAFRKNVLHKKYGLPLTMTEKEMTDEIKAYRIYDCGLLKYVWRNLEDWK